MSWSALPYALPLFAGAVLSALLAVTAFRRRELQGAVPFGWAMAAATWWSVCYAAHLLTPDHAVQILWTKLQYVGIEAAPLAWMMLGVVSSGRARWYQRWGWTLPTLVSGVTLVLVATNESHGLVWSEIGIDSSYGFSSLETQHGPWWWLHTAQAYLLMVGGTALLLRGIDRTAGNRRRARLVVFGVVAISLVGGLPNLLDIHPGPSLDLTPFAVTLSGLAIGLGHFRFRLLDAFVGLLPVAHGAIVAGMADAVVVLDGRDRVIELNGAARWALGVRTETYVGLRADTAFGEPLARRLLAGEGADRSTEAVLDVGGEHRHFEVRSTPLMCGKTVSGRIVVLHDVTERQAVEEALRRGEALLRAVVDQSHDGVYVRDAEGRLVLCNRAFKEITGYTLEDLNERGIVESLCVDPTQRKSVSRFTARVVASGSGVAELSLTRRDGTEFWARAEVRHLKSADRDLFIGTVSDITERRRHDARLAHLASHDQLTDLPNRRALETALERALAGARRGNASALLFIDADHFKAVNDTLGHSAGDRLLVSLARVLQGGLRDGDVLARVGGDEFAALLPGADLALAEAVAERLRWSVAIAPFVVERRSFPLTLSIGYAAIDGQASPREALAAADAAMYRAKQSGRNRVASAARVFATAEASGVQSSLAI